ncbi:MAG: sugar phosphate isomerase/epimerase, partial [Planctomycetes bacterium]|nr:sugar phosphate isomerase/epimerase [Planctomycetota bacterium]
MSQRVGMRFMELGFRTGAFRDWHLKDALTRLKSIGYDSVELCLEHPEMQVKDMTPAAVGEWNRCLSQIGLQASSLSHHCAYAPDDANMRLLLDAVAVAAGFEPRILVVSSPKAQPERHQEQIAQVVQCLKVLCAKAEAARVTIALEPEPALVVGNTDDMLAVVQAVHSPALKVNLDIGHAYLTEPSVPDTIARLGPLIVHTHFEDIAQKVHKHLIPGEGDIAFHPILDALRRVGYSGHCILDLFGPVVAADPAGFAERAYARMK